MFFLSVFHSKVTGSITSVDEKWDTCGDSALSMRYSHLPSPRSPSFFRYPVPGLLAVYVNVSMSILVHVQGSIARLERAHALT